MGVGLCDYGEVWVYYPYASSGNFYHPRGHLDCYYFFQFTASDTTDFVTMPNHQNPFGGVEMPTAASRWSITTGSTSSTALPPWKCDPHFRVIGTNGPIGGFKPVPAHGRTTSDVKTFTQANTPVGVEIRLRVQDYDGVTRYTYLRADIGQRVGYITAAPPPPPQTWTPPTTTPPPPPCDPSCCC